MFQRMKDGSLVRAPSCSAPHTHRRRRSSSSRAPHFSLLDAKNTDAVIDVCSFTFKSFGRPIPRSIWDEKVEKGGNFKEKKKFFPGNCPVATCLHRSFYFRCCCFFDYRSRRPVSLIRNILVSDAMFPLGLIRLVMGSSNL